MSITTRLDRIERFMRSRPEEEARPVYITKVPRKLTPEEWLELAKKQDQKRDDHTLEFDQLNLGRSPHIDAVRLQ